MDTCIFFAVFCALNVLTPLLIYSLDLAYVLKAAQIFSPVHSPHPMKNIMQLSLSWRHDIIHKVWMSRLTVWIDIK